ncbi:unnamed protein product [Blepharisma stoltei]|uniref:RING-type domain-containing protein n=1 Tax=Blepharisma stoltei TaxID=1481888 RepID=A0AAU9IVB2_9CILI|nr:unnamed protein product [Blepharisma stoltei]
MSGLMNSPINEEINLFSDEDLNLISSFTTRSSDLNLPCPICREIFALEEVLRALPRCGHIFHAACIDPWLMRNNPTCPVCRNNIRQSLTSLAS